jgi:nitroreductase
VNCIEKVLSRRSARRFKNEAVSEEVINSILEAAQPVLAENGHPF